jgi:extracellular factor (EF) 3-hydroxypalmitic acid methyl ester biosynthesis protein
MSVNEASFAAELLPQIAPEADDWVAGIAADSFESAADPSLPADPTPSSARPRSKLAIPRSARRLRPNRLRVEDLKLDGMTATAHHPSIGAVGGTVEDLSIHGMGVVVPIQQRDAPLVLAGDRLTRLTISATDRIVHEGAATVRRVAEHRDGLLLGLELDAPGLDLGELYRQGARRTLDDRWQKVNQAARYQDISLEFKAWVASLHAYLESVETFLAGEEKALCTEDLSSRHSLETELLDLVSPDVAKQMSAAISDLGTLVADLTDAEHAHYRAVCRMHLGRFFTRSPFMRRAHEKPLGYAGDYEMMNMLYRNHAEGADLFGKVMNLYATSERAAVANMNRIEFLGDKIRKMVQAQGGSRLRIASIGSGPGEEIRQLLMTSPELGQYLDITLIDQEKRAIAYCEKALSNIARSTGAWLRIIPESVRRLLAGRALSSALGPRDFVYSAGLFDYLSGRTFSTLLSTLYEALTPNGTLAVGNVSVQNPSRWAMEYFSEWFLIHRSEDDLLTLGKRLEPLPRSVRVESEPLGVNLFLIVER